MKKIFCLLLLFPLFLTAQESGLQKENAILKARVDSLESRMDDKFYTRVPNKDFDQQLNDSVDKQVSNYISRRLALISTIVGLMSFLLGYLAKYFFSESTRKQIDESVKAASDTIKNDNADAQKILNTQLEVQKSFISDNNKLYSDRLADISTRIDSLRNSQNNQWQQYSSNSDKRIGDFEVNVKTQITQLNDQFTSFYGDIKSKIGQFETTQKDSIKTSIEMLDNKITESLSFLWDDVVKAKMERAANNNYDVSQIKGIEKLLDTKIEINEEQRIKLIDTLMSCYYESSRVDKKYYDMMVKLIKSYEDKYELLPETYVNAAIAFSSNYELFGSRDLKDTAIVNCDKSIKRDRNYGIPYAVKVEISMIDLLKSREASDKMLYSREVDDLLYLVNSINSPYLKGAFLQRLLKDKRVQFLQRYIDGLYKNFSLQLAPIRENVIYELVKNYTKANENEKNILKELLEEGLNVNPDIDRLWKVVEYLDNGKPVDVQAGMYLELKGSDYSYRIQDQVVEKGIVYYLPYAEPYALDLICKEGKTGVTFNRGIYQEMNDGRLQICIGKDFAERPQQFISDPAHDNSLLTFVKE